MAIDTDKATSEVVISDERLRAHGRAAVAS